MIVCRRNTVREREREFAHIFLLWRGPFLWISLTVGGHTRGADRSAWVTSGSLPLLERPADHSSSFERPLDLCLQPKISDLILSFKFHEHASSSTYFSVRGWLSELTYFRFFFGNLLILSANGNMSFYP